MWKEIKELWQYATQDLSKKEVVMGSIVIVLAMLLLSVNCSCTNAPKYENTDGDVEYNFDIHEIEFEGHTYLVWQDSEQDGRVVSITHDIECKNVDN